MVKSRNLDEWHFDVYDVGDDNAADDAEAEQDAVRVACTVRDARRTDKAYVRVQLSELLNPTTGKAIYARGDIFIPVVNTLLDSNQN